LSFGKEVVVAAAPVFFTPFSPCRAVTATINTRAEPHAFFKLRINHHYPALDSLDLDLLRPAATLEMELMVVIIRILALIPDAYRNAERLPVALISGGVVETVAAIFLAFFKPPGGLFEHHGKAPFYLYYGILGFVAVFGFAEATA
jgi:hypothetical protein